MSSTTGKTAIVFGATGLVGSHLLQLLLSDDRYEKVLVFHRRSIGVTHPKLTEHTSRFEEINVWKHLIQGDELYSALGTTLKKAGTKRAQFRVDYDHQFNVAEAAAANGVSSYCLISSVGATRQSKNFYLNMKGQLDNAVKQLAFKKICILRPSFLDGNRKEKRTKEKMGLAAFNLVSLIPGIRKYRPIHAHQVAEAMINALNQQNTKDMYEADEIFELLK
ncbi:MAG: NAD-dependent epimerase/dehydratase family protein [Balneola sp.]|nr:MAG: NAD-dependent epimerase/dehydratase family protein [Balneola sp.]